MKDWWCVQIKELNGIQFKNSLLYLQFHNPHNWISVGIMPNVWFMYDNASFYPRFNLQIW